MNKNNVITRIKDTFSIKNLIKVMLSILLAWIIRHIIINYFNLDVSNLWDTFMAYTPAVIAASILKIYLEDFEIKITPEMNVTEYKTNKTPDSKKVIKFNYDINDIIDKDMKNTDNKRWKQSLKADSKSLSRLTSRDLERKRLQFGIPEEETVAIAESIRVQADIHRAQAEVTAEINRNAQVNHQRRWEYAARQDPGTILVDDSQGVGARGFSNTQTNRPFANDLADALQTYAGQNRQNAFCWPPLDPVSRRFLVDALPTVHPTAYGPNPTIRGQGYTCTKQVIRNLRRLP